MLGDDGLRVVEGGSEEVDGLAVVGARPARGFAVDGETDQGVAPLVDGVGGVASEPGAHGVVQGVAVQTGQ